MSRLVIAEKPSLAQSLSEMLGAKKKNDGYLESGAGWAGVLVTPQQPVSKGDRLG